MGPCLSVQIFTFLQSTSWMALNFDAKIDQLGLPAQEEKSYYSVTNVTVVLTHNIKPTIKISVAYHKKSESLQLILISGANWDG